MKIPLILCSHAVLGLAAWGIAREYQPTVPPVQTHLPTLSTKRIREPGPDSAGPTVRDNILAALPKLTLPPDPAASIRGLLSTTDESSSIQAAALLLLWCRSSADEALRFVSDDDSLRTMIREDKALELIGETIPPEILLSMRENYRRDNIFAGMARQLIASHDVGELAEMLQGLDQDLKNSVTYHIGKQWPAERLDDYGRLATAMGDIEMLDRIGDHLSREEAAKWMMRYINENPGPEFANRIRASMTYFALMRDSPGLPLEDRLTGVLSRPLYKDQPAEAARKDALEFLASNDVSGFFQGEVPDLRHAFHHGKIEAFEILARINERFPQYKATGKLPELLYVEIASEDPERALPLLAHLPEQVRAHVIAEGFSITSSLETVGRTLATFPASDDEDILSSTREIHPNILPGLAGDDVPILSSRKEIWKKATDNGLYNYGKEYLNWISTLPDPLDRKLALEAIADCIEGSMGYKANEIREIIGDFPLRDTP